MNLWRKFREKSSVNFAKNPGRVIIVVILWVNLSLIFISSLVLSFCTQSGGTEEGYSFWRTVYRVLSIMFDAGGISDIVGQHPEENPIVAIICIIVILVSMVIFTGAAIGYLTNLISGIFDSAKSGTRRLVMSEHIVLINWNSRGSEIINDLLYSEHEEQVVVLVNENSEEVEQEINNRIADTIERDKRDVIREANELIEKGKLSKKDKKKYIKEHLYHTKVTVIVRQGETYSLKQLNDISILNAKTVIILSKDERLLTCKYELKGKLDRIEKGNTNTIKTLIQVAQLTASEESRNSQKIVVEVEDDWTLSLVEKVIKQKARDEKCIIVPILVNRVLGQILSQFSIMPELNTIYSELFSNSGLTFYSSAIQTDLEDNDFIRNYLYSHQKALPVTIMDIEGKKEFYYIAKRETDNKKTKSFNPSTLDLEINKNYSFERKHIAILGHNSKCIDVMKGFIAFLNEWNRNYHLIDLLIIDNKEHLEKVNYYQEFQDYLPMKIIEADVYEKDLITEKLSHYIDSNFEDTSILILSDDQVNEDEIDANSLTYLIYVQDIIAEKMRKSKAGELERFHSDSIDVVVELINPKNYDVARSYSANNVIISNRYISKMVVQLGDKEEIYSFYKDILTYDDFSETDDYSSKELYVKVAERFFSNKTVFPFKTTSGELIREVYDKTPDNNKSILIAKSHHGTNKMLLDDLDEEITITADDKLILFSPH